MPWRAPALATEKPLIVLVDHGPPVVLDRQRFPAMLPGRDWGPFAESFMRLNESALAALDLRANVAPDGDQVTLRLLPGGRAGAMPLRSPQTGRVEAGVLVVPRFEWQGVGEVLQATGWHSAPQFHDVPLVPGSAKQVPPWVIAGPVLVRIAALLRSLRRGYEVKEEVLETPRGTIDWSRYVTGSLPRGQWHRLPCRFPDLGRDPKVRAYARWSIERVRVDLASIASGQEVVRALLRSADMLLLEVSDVLALRPTPVQLDQVLRGRLLDGEVLLAGLQAIGWVSEERGLGGDARLDGLAWHLSLEELWECYVESVVRREEAGEGAEVHTGRLGETTFPLHWSDRAQRSLGSLVPDVVVRKGRAVKVIDAKYKAHLAEIDEFGWRRIGEEVRDAHRADLHQVLAYAALYQADEITASLVYPLRPATFERLRARGRDRSVAELLHGGRVVRLELRGLPFGRAG